MCCISVRIAIGNAITEHTARNSSSFGLGITAFVVKESCSVGEQKLQVTVAAHEAGVSLSGFFRNDGEGLGSSAVGLARLRPRAVAAAFRRALPHGRQTASL